MTTKQLATNFDDTLGTDNKNKDTLFKDEAKDKVISEVRITNEDKKVDYEDKKIEKLHALMRIICSEKTPPKLKKELFIDILDYIEKEQLFDKAEREVYNNLLKIYKSKYINKKTLRELDEILYPFIEKHSQKDKTKTSQDNELLYFKFAVSRYLTISQDTLKQILEISKNYLKKKNIFSLSELQLISKIVNKKIKGKNNKSSNIIEYKAKIKGIIEECIDNMINNDESKIYKIIENPILKRDILNAVSEQTIIKIAELILRRMDINNDKDKWLRGFISFLSLKRIIESKELVRQLLELDAMKELIKINNNFSNYIKTIIPIEKY